MSKFTRDDLKNWFRDTHPAGRSTQSTDKDGLMTESYGDMNDPYNPDANPDLVMRDMPKPMLQPGRMIYALISVPYESSIILSEDSIEELRKEINHYTSSGHASLEAIFYADIIEGEL